MNQLLEKLNELSIKLSLKGDNLDIQAPKGTVTPNILEEIKNHKEEIISFLKDLSSRTGIPRSEKKDFYPLSSTQKRMWLLQQMNPENVAYHMPMIFEIEGELNIDRLQKTFRALVKRHESLRTVFREDDHGNPVQIVKEFKEDLFHLESTDISKDILENVQKSIDTPFDLTKGELFRGNIFRISDQKYLLLIVMHHIISDGWSVEVLAKDFFELYKNIDNTDFSLPALPIQYKDYAVWQQEKIKDQNSDKEYWLSVFNDEIPVLELPSYKARPKYKSGKGHTISEQISEQNLSQFQKLCSDNEATLFMGIKTLVDVLLYKYSHQNDIIVGTPIANREYPELQDQIGFYANTLALRANVNSAQSFLNLLNSNKIQLLDAYQYQEYPFDELVANLRLPYDPSRNPLFDVMVSLQENSEIEASQIENLTMKKFIVDDHTSKFDLAFSFYIEDNRLHLDLTYDSEIYDEKLAGGLIKHACNLIEKIIDNENASIKDLNFLSPQEHHQLLLEFNDTSVDYPRDKTMIELFEAQVEKTPDHIAVVFEDTELTYRELNEQSNQLGAYLRKNYDTQADDLVTIKLDRSEQMIVAILGVLKSGAAYVPIDPEYPEDRIAYIEEDTRAKITIDESFLNVFQQELQSTQHQYTKDNLPVISRPDSLAYIIYTSGTTGKPKGVMIENKGLINLCHWHNKSFDVNADSKSALFSGQGFDASVWEIFPYLLSGGCLYPLANEIKYDINKLSEFYLNRSITHSYLPPFVLKELLEKNNIDNITFLSGGEALDNIRTKNNTIYNNYGPTENSVVTSCYKLERHQNYTAVPIGKPISNTQVYILDEDLNLVPVGVSGKLYVSGAGLSRGYLNKVELTAEKFIDNPFEAGSKMYDTGDLARWLPDGNIEFLGRKDFQVKIRGYRIELGEIESCIAQFSTAIKQVVAEAKEVNGEKVLVAYYTSSLEATEAVGSDAAQIPNIDKTVLREYLQSKLPDYMVPGYFVELEAIPLTPNGKIDRKSLPGVSGEDLIRREYVAPRNETEQKLSEIWQEVLGLERVGVTDNFFELGGHSLMVAQVLNKIYQNLGIQVSLKDFFASPTIKKITQNYIYYEEKEIHESTKIQASVSNNVFGLISYLKLKKISLKIDGEKIIIVNNHYIENDILYDNIKNNHKEILNYFKKSPKITRIRASQLQRDVYKFVINNSYNSNINFGFIVEKLNMPKLHRAFENLIKNNQILMSSFELVEDVLHLKYLKDNFSIIELNFNTKKEAIKYLKAKTLEIFNIFDNKPLLKVYLIHIPQKDILFFVINHLIFDGLSLYPMIKELFNNYYEKRVDTTKIQFHEYIAAKEYFPYTNEYRVSENFWKGEFLQSYNAPLLFPKHIDKYADDFYDTFIIKSKLSKTILAKVENYCRIKKTTINIFILSIYYYTLQSLTKKQDIILDCTSSGRESDSLINEIGLFTNSIFLRLNIRSKDFTNVLEFIKSKYILAVSNSLYDNNMVYNNLNLSVYGHELLRRYKYNFIYDQSEPGDLLNITPFSIEKKAGCYYLLINIYASEHNINYDFVFNKKFFTKEEGTEIVKKFNKKIKELIYEKH
ncbi:amino acid adenylation domain-containing protein [Chryseobacterium defluvii]|uniref:Amino acid adenylation domain-containing protein n=1 Tax=Chryseobacterium defluvii TaxID=160396 RepID=A0A840KLE7_9FLAO|nr:non-ribosomal peptide synthetase [Chryseobacterium defluvii]MBB4808303.1 amino acid adenylation domain-containing protein [Chryseobacterium defluvii]